MEADRITVAEFEALSAYLDLLPAYDQSWQTDALLDIERQVWDADNYYWYGIPFPTGGDIIFNQTGSPNVLQTFSGDITVPPFAILTKITYFQGLLSDGVGAPSGRCKLRVYDKGGKVDMIHKQFAMIDNVASNMTGQDTGLLSGQNDPFGPYMLMERKIVMPPGVLHLEITDMSGVANIAIQVLLSFAVPRNRQSLGMVTED